LVAVYRRRQIAYAINSGHSINVNSYPSGTGQELAQRSNL